MNEAAPTQPASLTDLVHTAPEDIPVKDVARLMTARGIGSVVVVDKQQRPIGIITDRDIVVRVTAPEQDVRVVTVGAVMSKPVVTITKSQDIGAAVGMMALHGIRRLPIVDETGRLASILTLDDILRFKLADPAELTQIVRDRPQPARSAPVPASAAATTFETGLVFKPAMTSPEAGGAGQAVRPVASVAERSKVVTMVKRRRRRTLVEEARHAIYVNKTWAAIVVGLALLLVMASYLLLHFGELVSFTDHYEPKDEERHFYQYMQEKQRHMQEKQRLQEGRSSGQGP